jgi:putative glutamine amidotransferase
MTPRPLVAVPAYHLANDRVARWLDGGYGVPAPYLDGLRRAGARTAIIAPGEEGDAGEILAPFDALLLVGGGDIDPARYRAVPDTEHNYGVEDDRDRFEIALLHAARRSHLPTLCICRGMQVMNVAFGGTLHQHLPAMAGLVPHGVPLDDSVAHHDVHSAVHSLLRRAAGEPDLSCSSHHHQGIDRMGDGLVATGWSADDLVEAIEVDDARGLGWMLGVQWHPEETAAGDPAQQSLFDELVRAGQAARVTE